MAWTDKPTYAQLQVVYRALLSAKELSTLQARNATKYLEKKANRREISIEMNRLKRLEKDYKLSIDNCFDSKIWEGFSYD